MTTMMQYPQTHPQAQPQTQWPPPQQGTQDSQQQMQAHVIWGGLEEGSITASSTEHPSSSLENSQSSRQGAEKVGKVNRRGGLSKDVLNHLQKVNFRDQSGSSDSGALGSPNHSASFDRRNGNGGSGGASGSAGPSGKAPGGIQEGDAQAEGEEEDGQSDDGDIVTLGEGADMTEFWSAGSVGHSNGECRPCHYIHTPTGCRNGRDCSFCHMPHVKKNRPRPCKSKRLQCKKFIRMLEDVSQHDPESLGEAVQHACHRSAYLKDMLMKRVPPSGQGTSEVEQLVNSVTTQIACDTPAPTRRKNIVSL